ncbi:DUF2271 domain-containing protein [Mucilaginibacter sp. ZT4R22]|uniref:DUF2271 domain-containing protein n=1 Tax=Mucilaginibacter pankratovii TaxID=2772110 RepID=A0ABR7WRI8_9SPHI|nr:DUF2271 domain-containing protein [Mucilaginibacter pankratovii]MBD1364916.1 DUF2271 domain-containing protein [Mucilaginibacter pankratovii]
MSKISSIVFFVLALTFAGASASFAQTTKYKCMIQMTNYMGEGAYISISLVDSKGAYEKTLYVLGSDKKWYKTLKEWNKFYLKNQAGVSAITGASVTGGDRSVNVIEIENSKINTGYKLRFESAVEDKAYNVKDLEIPLTTETLSAKSEGTGYIRYVRFSAN